MKTDYVNKPMPHRKDFNPVYSEMLFRIDTRDITAEELSTEMSLAADEFQDHLSALIDLGLVNEEKGKLLLDWRRMKESYVSWLDNVVDERIFFAEQIDRSDIREYYEPLKEWTSQMRDDVIHNEGLTKIFQNGFRNFTILIEHYRTQALSIAQFFNEFTMSFADYEKFVPMVGEDKTLRKLSDVCERAMVNPFAFFAFHTEYTPIGT